MVAEELSKLNIKFVVNSKYLESEESAELKEGILTWFEMKNKKLCKKYDKVIFNYDRLPQEYYSLYTEGIKYNFNNAGNLINKIFFFTACNIFCFCCYQRDILFFYDP